MFYLFDIYLVFIFVVSLPFEMVVGYFVVESREVFLVNDLRFDLSISTFV